MRSTMPRVFWRVPPPAPYVTEQKSGPSCRSAGIVFSRRFRSPSSVFVGKNSNDRTGRRVSRALSKISRMYLIKGCHSQIYTYSMGLTRREWLAGTVQLAAAATIQPPEGVLPDRRAFAIPAGQTYLNSAFIHPIPIAAARAVHRYIETREFSRERWSGDALAVKVRAQFAALIGAAPEEISLVESTSRGENLVVNGLGRDVEHRQRGHRRAAFRRLAHPVRRAEEARSRRATRE